MFLAQDRDSHPNFVAYLKRLPLVQFVPKIWTPFVKWSGLSESQAKKTVAWGMLPWIHLGPITMIDHGGFDEKFPDRITIKSAVVRAYENRQDFKDEKYLEKLILHETIHWARNLLGMPDKEEGPLRVDSGDQFENAAYTNPYQPWLP